MKMKKRTWLRRWHVGFLMPIVTMVVLFTWNPSGNAELKKKSVPDHQTLRTMRVATWGKYVSAFKKAKLPKQKVALVNRMLRDAEKAEGIERYVILHEARNVSMLMGDVAGAFITIERVGREFQIDIFSTKVNVVSEIIGRQPNTLRDSGVFDSILSLVDEAIINGDVQVAKDLVATIHASLERLRPAQRSLERRVASKAEITEALSTLRKQKDDADANLTLGNYYCFEKNDWETGLPMLAKGSNEKLSQLAKRDVVNPKDPAQQFELAEAWWDLAMKSDEGEVKTNQISRARHWYKKAFAGLKDRRKERSKKRLDLIANRYPNAIPLGFFEGRFGKRKQELIKSGGATVETECAVAAGLNWIIEHQLADGGWSFDHRGASGCGGRCAGQGSMADDRIAATALALLPFLGAGHTHQDGEYQNEIERALKFLDSKKTPVKYPFSFSFAEKKATMYSHGLASIAFSESYALTRDPNLKLLAQAALNYIAHAQDPKGGGWRYTEKAAGDTSVLGWQFAALKAGQEAGLAVNPRVVAGAKHFLDSVQSEGGSAYGYLSPGNRTSTNAIGLLCRMYLGWTKDTPALKTGVQRISRARPSRINLYYNYYATQVMRHYGGTEWKTWNNSMSSFLLQKQEKSGHQKGSWHLGSSAMNGRSGGRLYYTALATMILEVYYRHVPLYEG